MMMKSIRILQGIVLISFIIAALSKEDKLALVGEIFLFII